MHQEIKQDVKGKRQAAVRGALPSWFPPETCRPPLLPSPVSYLLLTWVCVAERSSFNFSINWPCSVRTSWAFLFYNTLNVILSIPTALTHCQSLITPTLQKNCQYLFCLMLPGSQLFQFPLMLFSKWNVFKLIFNACPYGLISKHLCYAVSLLQNHCTWTWHLLRMKDL